MITLYTLVIKMATKKIEEKTKRNFALRKGGAEDHVYTGWTPRDAALKAATVFGGTPNNPRKVELREKGTTRVHVFSAWKEKVDAPENRPTWMPEKIWRSNVKKEGVYHIKEK